VIGDAPSVRVDETVDGYVTERLTIPVGGARSLAAALLATADQIDGWAGR
jgi:hypothetical protein